MARAGWWGLMPNAFALAYSEWRARGLEPLPSFSACLCGNRSFRRVSARPGWLRAADASPELPAFFPATLVQAQLARA